MSTSQVLTAKEQDIIIYEKGDVLQSIIGDKVMVRSSEAGVFVGRLVTGNMDTGVVVLRNTTRIWYWSGAASLSELALWGPAYPDECKFPDDIKGNHIIAGVIEVIPVTNQAWKSIKSVPRWACNSPDGLAEGSKAELEE